MAPPLRVPLALRLLLLSGLVLVLVLRGTGEGRGWAGGTLSLDTVGPEATTRLLVLDEAPPLLRRTASRSPDPAELLRLTALSGSIPLEVVLPGGPSPPRLDPPRWARAERAGALMVRLHGELGVARQVRVEGDAGIRDTVEVVPDASGLGQAVLPLRPVREGWHGWTAVVDGDTATGGVLVAPARPIRVLALAGGAGWEARFAVRALEESGVAVTLRQPLGGGRWVTGSAEQGMLPVPAFEEMDVLLLLPGGEVPASLAPGLEAWLTRGGGLVAVAAAGDTLILPGAPGPAVAGRQEEVPASALRWTLPPELVPLPPLALDIPVLPLTGLDPAEWLAGISAPGGGDPVLAVRGVGSGRIAVLGLPATWLWRMEGGALAEHRTFWRRMMEWAAGAGDRNIWAMPPEGGVPGDMIRVPLEWTDPEPPGLRLRHPDGTDERLTVATRAPGRGEALFVPRAEGLYVLLDEASEEVAAVPVSGHTRPPPDAVPTAVRLAGASGGGAVAAGGETGETFRDPFADPGSSTLPSLLLLGLLTAVAAAEWALRRLRGLP